MFKFEKRPEQSQKWIYLSPFLAVLITMISGGILFATLGENPFEAIRIIFWDPLFDPSFASYSRPQLLVKAGPLILIAIGLSFGFKAGVWNIGAEGQYILGAIFGASVALAFYPMESKLIFPLMIIAGALGGFLWGLIPALLKAKLNTNVGIGFFADSCACCVTFASLTQWSINSSQILSIEGRMVCVLLVM